MLFTSNSSCYSITVSGWANLTYCNPLVTEYSLSWIFSRRLPEDMSICVNMRPHGVPLRSRSNEGNIGEYVAISEDPIGDSFVHKIVILPTFGQASCIIRREDFHMGIIKRTMAHPVAIWMVLINRIKSRVLPMLKVHQHFGSPYRYVALRQWWPSTLYALLRTVSSNSRARSGCVYNDSKGVLNGI